MRKDQPSLVADLADICDELMRYGRWLQREADALFPGMSIPVSPERKPDDGESTASRQQIWQQNL